jgi:putative lipoprotein
VHVLAAILIVAGLMLGCRTVDPPSAESPGGSRAAADGIDEPASTAAPLAAYAFECDDEQTFVLSRIAGKTDALDLALGERHQRLTHVRTASGAQYAADGVSVWTKGREAMLEIAGRVTTCRENRRRSILEDARARGVEFRASGNEPGWVWELLSNRMVFVGAYGADRITTSRVDAPNASTQGGAVYLGVAESRRMTVHVVPGPCVDTMSGELAMSTVQVELDGKTYRGCGDALR